MGARRPDLGDEVIWCVKLRDGNSYMNVGPMLACYSPKVSELLEQGFQEPCIHTCGGVIVHPSACIVRLCCHGAVNPNTCSVRSDTTPSLIVPGGEARGGLRARRSHLYSEHRAAFCADKHEDGIQTSCLEVFESIWRPFSLVSISSSCFHNRG